MNFRVKMDNGDIDVWELPKNQTHDSSSITVEWHCEFECREWGVKSISAYVTKVYGSIYLSEEINNDDYKEIEVLIDSSDKEKWTLDSQMEIDHDSISVNNVEFNFKNKTIIVT